MTPEERIARSIRAKGAVNEFLSPAFQLVIADYMGKLTEMAAREPWEADKIRKLAAAVQIAREVEKQIMAVVNDGDVAKAEKARADNISELPERKRRWAMMAGGM